MELSKFHADFIYKALFIIYQLRYIFRDVKSILK